MVLNGKLKNIAATEGVEERVRELLERSTLKRGDFDGVHDTVEVSTNMCVKRR